MFKKNKVSVEINKRNVCDKLWQQYLYYERKEFEMRQIAFKENDPNVKAKIEHLAIGYKEAKDSAFVLSKGIDWIYTAENMLTFSS